MLVDLYTKQAEDLSGMPWEIYPRPQMRRDSFYCLNDRWEFTVTEGEIPEIYPKKIRVPFCPESLLSGIHEHFPEGSALYYRRKVTLPADFCKGRVLLHIGAADQHLTTFVNGKEVGSHSGGYEAMTFDITDVLQEENEIVLRCVDDLRDLTMPYGKQTMTRGGMWYTPVSGIWQSVWLESVSETYIQALDICADGEKAVITVTPAQPGKVLLDGKEYPLTEGRAVIVPDAPRLWSPEDPYLYEFSVVTDTDRVDSYFALRSLQIKTVDGYPRLLLNGKPYFFHGLLDQGYWPDGIYTPASPECYAEDILAMKKLGFNMLRKHIKVEPEEFYYQCDKLGMVVFQDMVNNGDYSYVRDTVIPTLGVQKRKDRNMHKDPAARKVFLDSMAGTVAQLKNHPSIVYWTIFNEGWGQFDSQNAYEELKKLDSSRFIDSTSGWFRGNDTDVESMHIYFTPWSWLKACDKPLVLSEFGGYCYAVPEHIFNPEKAYGYKSCKTAEEFTAALEQLYRQRIIPAAEKGLCAAVYTQVSDVEDEINGLLTYDRKVCKANEKTMTDIAAALQKAVQG